MEKVKGRKIRKKEDIIKEDKKEFINMDSEFSYIKVRKRKIKNVINNKDDVIISKDEYMDHEDKNIENDDNFSLGLMIFILVLCVIVGVVLGYLLYRLAINSSVM